MTRIARTRYDRQQAGHRVRSETPITLVAAGKLVKAPTKTGHVGGGTVSRWIRKGKSGVYLDAAKIVGKGLCTSEAALARFFAELDGQDVGGEDVPRATVTEREGRARAAMERLGVGVGVGAG